MGVLGGAMGCHGALSGCCAGAVWVLWDASSDVGIGWCFSDDIAVTMIDSDTVVYLAWGIIVLGCLDLISPRR